jgi:CheY-like chemotaxis protein
MFTILVVEDEPDLQLLMRIFLRKFGYNVLTADNGVKAIQILQEYTPDLIFTDIMMPFMDGFELVKEIKAHPEWRKIPVLVASSVDVRKSIGSDIEGCLQKPINFNELKVMLSQILTSI